MRRAVISSALAAGVAAFVLLTAGPSSGSTSGAEGPGGTVTVGASEGGSAGGSPGSQGSPGGPGSPGATNGNSGGSPWSCTYMPLELNDQALPPGGPTPGGWFSMTCTNAVTGASFNQTLWLSGQAASPPAAAVPSVDPHALALEAERSLQLPEPAIHFSPSTAAVVNLPTWLWIDNTIWHPYSVTASAGFVSATAVATPISVTWTMGDGGVLTCGDPGVPFDATRPASEQTTSCQHSYRISSAGEPSTDGSPDDAAFAVLATVSWSVAWSAQGAPGGGVLPDLTTAAVTRLRVEQVESIFGGTQDPVFPGRATQ